MNKSRKKIVIKELEFLKKNYKSQKIYESKLLKNESKALFWKITDQKELQDFWNEFKLKLNLLYIAQNSLLEE